MFTGAGALSTIPTLPSVYSPSAKAGAMAVGCRVQSPYLQDRAQMPVQCQGIPIVNGPPSAKCNHQALKMDHVGTTGGGGGQLQPVLMRHPPPAICQNWGRGGLGGGQLGGVSWRVWGGGSAGGSGGGVTWRVWGGGLEGVCGGGGESGCGGGGDSQGGGAYARPTTTTCIPLGEMCVWGGFGEAAGGCCEAGAADWQVCPQWLW